MSDAHLIVSVPWGPKAGLKLAIAPGERLRVGRTERADLAIPQDDKLAAVHFELAWDGAACHVRELGEGHGLKVAGAPASEAVIGDRGWVRAGSTDFVLRVEGSVPPPASVHEDLRRLPRRVRAERERQRALRAEAAATLAAVAGEGRLHAVLDAVRDERILELVATARDASASLYDGVQGAAWSAQAPHLVRFDHESRLLERLVDEGWGARWGIFLTSAQPFKELRRHLRRLLVVQDDETSERLLFRFYDPGVLRVFLPTCLPGQVDEFWGDVEAFLFEGEDGGLVRRERPDTLAPSTEPAS